MRQPRFADSLTLIINDPAYADNEFMLGMATTIDDPYTKRILVDADLWQDLFGKEPPPKSDLSSQFWPFGDPIYLESTRPILPAPMTLVSEDLTRAVAESGVDPATEPSWLRAMLILPTAPIRRDVCTITTWGREVLASVMKLDIRTGETTSEHHGATPEIATFLQENPDNPGLGYLGRALSSLITHINRSSVRLEPQPADRATRRRLQRLNRENPWYLIHQD